MSKVVLMKCEEYDVEIIYEKIKWAINELGGLESIIPKDKKVLLKPNMLVGTDKENAVTTNPAVFEAVARLFSEYNYSLTFGDSPGFGNPAKAASKTGIKAAADKYNIPQADFVNGKTVSTPDSVLCKQFEIANAVLEADAIVNLPKMKAHALQRITGAIKNPFGCVVGFNKGLMHSRFTNAYNFAEMIVDLDNYLKVDLHIMDGIMAMEGNGPRNGDPVKMNVILVSTDPVALDTVFCKLVDVNPMIIPTITYGQKYGLGKYDDIEIIGDKIEPLINKKFNIDRNTLKKEDSSSLSFLRRYVIRRPYILEDICKKCGVCVEVCPLEDKAVNWVDGDKTKPPVYDYKKCIRCYCCQEMCPYHVIKVKTPVIGKVLYGLKIIK
jgi:uncharacterized protein (DUF362 family)/NAD-dependent dihydropyrimidine dehydrogenase PreA subunit